MLDRFLADLRQELSAEVGHQQANLVAIEIEGHLRERTTALEELGLSHFEAERDALKEFGDRKVFAESMADVRTNRSKQDRLAYGVMVMLAVSMAIYLPLAMESRSLDAQLQPLLIMAFLAGLLAYSIRRFTPKIIGVSAAVVFVGLVLSMSITSVPGLHGPIDKSQESRLAMSSFNAQSFIPVAAGYNLKALRIEIAADPAAEVVKQKLANGRGEFLAPDLYADPETSLSPLHGKAFKTAQEAAAVWSTFRSDVNPYLTKAYDDVANYEAFKKALSQPIWTRFYAMIPNAFVGSFIWVIVLLIGNLLGFALAKVQPRKRMNLA